MCLAVCELFALLFITSALQKCVNHPYLYDTKYEPKTKDKVEEQKLLIQNSGKLTLLDQMLFTFAEQSKDRGKEPS